MRMLLADNAPSFHPSRAFKDNVGAVEGGSEHERVAHAQLRHNVLLHPLRGGGGECHERQAGQLLPQRSQPASMAGGQSC